MSEAKRAGRTDATVTDVDGLAWIEELLRDAPHLLLDKFATLEPTVLGLAARVARVMREELISKGVPERLAEYVFDKTLLTSVICAELMRRGHAKLWSELVEPEPHAGDDNEKPMPR